MSPKELVWIKYAIKSSSLLPRPVIYRQLTDLFNLSLKSLEFQFLMTGSWQKFSLGSKIKVGQRKNPNNHGPISAINRIQGV